MLIAQSWLERLLEQGTPSWSVPAAELDAGFVRVGFETEGYEPIPETTGPLVLGRVAEIIELEGFKKPIRHCQVDVGQANGTGELQSIVCGARNFQEGDTVVVSLPGAVLPGNFAISARETYGKLSAGMICSAAELGLATKQNSGIIVLDSSVGQPGDDARPILGLSDTVFDVNITPDRGYALSARGLARELASAFEIPFVDPANDPQVAGISTAAVPAADGELLEVELGAETEARRFGLRQVTGIDPNAETPFWLQRELASAFIDGKVWVTPRGQHWLRAPRQPLPVEPWGSLHLVSLLLLLLRAGAGTALPYCSRAIPALGAVPGRADALGAVQPRKAIPVGMCHASPMGQSSGLAALGLALNPRIGGSHPLVAVVREGGHELWLAG